MQMKIVIAVMIRFFKFKSAPDTEVRYRPAMTLLMSEDGLNLEVTPR